MKMVRPFLNSTTSQNILPKSGTIKTLSNHVIMISLLIGQKQIFRNGDEEWQKIIGEHKIELDLTQVGFLCSDWPL